MKRRWLKVLVVLSVLVGGGYLTLCGLAYKYQDRLIYFPDDYFPQDPASAGLEFEDFELDTGQGNTVTGWVVKSEPQAPWVLLFHGNAGNISSRVDYLKLFHDLGYNSAVFDYRGYGRSKGTPTEEGLVADGAAVVKYLKEKHQVSENYLIYFGESLGGGVAAALAVNEPPRALILKSTFTSLVDISSDVYPFLPSGLLLRSRYPTKEAIATFLFPKLIIHGRSDTIIPFAHGQRLFQGAGEPKTFLEIYGGHNTGPLELGAEFKNALKEFIDGAIPQE